MLHFDLNVAFSVRKQVGAFCAAMTGSMLNTQIYLWCDLEDIDHHGLIFFFFYSNYVFMLFM